MSHSPADTLTFSSSDIQDIHYPHDDPLVVTLTIANYAVKRVLIDIRSLSNILFALAFDQFGIFKDRLWPVATQLVGFNGSSTQPLGMIKLLVLIGTHLQQVSTITKFVVVEALSSYNVILGRPTLNQARAVVSTYNLIIKFPTPQGAGVLKGDQATTRSCYVTYLSKAVVLEALNVGEMGLREEKGGMSLVEGVTQIILDLEHCDRFVSVGFLLEPVPVAELTQFLKQNQNVFTWSHEEMPGIDPQVMSHRLNVDLSFRPIKQKRRGMALE